MAEIHYLKRDKNEAVVKVYSSKASGETVDRLNFSNANFNDKYIKGWQK